MIRSQKRRRPPMTKRRFKPRLWKWSRKKRKSRKLLRRKVSTQKKWKKFWPTTISSGRTKWVKLSTISRIKWNILRTNTRLTWKILTNSTKSWCRWMRQLSNRTWMARIKSMIALKKYMIKKSRTYLKMRRIWLLSSKWEASRNNGLLITPLAKEKALPQPWPI